MNRNSKRSLSYYRVIPRIVKIGEPWTVTIYPLGKGKRFDDTIDHVVSFIPKECFDKTWINPDEPPVYDTVTVRPVEGVISVTYTFEEEQEWVISIKPQTDLKISPKKLSLEFGVYSVADDLYSLNPYRGDLHVHSTGSDGREDPVVVAANYRKEGYDFFALTDHSNWDSSDELIKAYSDVSLGMKIFHGEEVHIRNNWAHIVNFGSRYSVVSLFRSDSEKYIAEIEEKAKNLDTPKGVNALEWAYREWVADEIHRAGGFAIVAHPKWIYHQVYNMSDRMLEYVLDSGKFDALELVGGLSVHENNMQTAFYQEERAKGKNIAIVGSSDAHGTDPASHFGEGQTIVFAKDMEFESICNAIKSGYSAVVEHMNGESERVYGSYRLVKYTRFLLDHYFPSHDELCVEEGRLMREYALGDVESGKALAALSGRAARNMNKILRGEESTEKIC